MRPTCQPPKAHELPLRRQVAKPVNRSQSRRRLLQSLHVAQSVAKIVRFTGFSLDYQRLRDDTQPLVRDEPSRYSFWMSLAEHAVTSQPCRTSCSRRLSAQRANLAVRDDIQDAQDLAAAHATSRARQIGGSTAGGYATRCPLSGFLRAR